MYAGVQLHKFIYLTCFLAYIFSSITAYCAENMLVAEVKSNTTIYHLPGYDYTSYTYEPSSKVKTALTKQKIWVKKGTKLKFSSSTKPHSQQVLHNGEKYIHVYLASNPFQKGWIKASFLKQEKKIIPSVKIVNNKMQDKVAVCTTDLLPIVKPQQLQKQVKDITTKITELSPSTDLNNFGKVPLLPRYTGRSGGVYGLLVTNDNKGKHNKEGLSRNCDSFITKNGNLGSNGKEIIRQIRKHKSYYTPKAKKASVACPNWHVLTNKEKEVFWVWAFAILAHTESSCNPRAFTKGVKADPEKVLAKPDEYKDGYRMASGLFQLEYSVGSRVDSARPDICKKMTPAQTKEARPNIACAVSIMSDFLDDSEREVFYSRNSYWQKLVRVKQRKDIKFYLDQLPFCKK